MLQRKNIFMKSVAILALLGIGGCGGYFMHMFKVDRQERAAWHDVVMLSWKMQEFRNHIRSLESSRQAEHLQESWPMIEKDLATLYQKHKQTSFAFCFLYFKSPLVFKSLLSLDLAFELFKDAWNKLATQDIPGAQKSL